MENKKTTKYVIRFFNAVDDEPLDALLEAIADDDPRLRMRHTLIKMYGKKGKKH